MQLQTDDFIKDLERWSKAYLNHIKALNYAQNTIELYNRAIEQFIEFSLGEVDNGMSMDKIKSIYITNFLAYLEERAKKRVGQRAYQRKPLSKSTKETYLKAIKNFFSFISDNNDELYTYDRFFKNIKIANSSQTEEKIVYLLDDEIQRLNQLLEKKKGKKNPFNAYRLSFLYKLMLYGGLRISEALNVHLEDFSEKGEVYAIKIFAKGNKIQTAYIKKSIIEDELLYFRARLKKDELIVQTKSKKPFSREAAYRDMDKLYKEAGVDKRGLHLLRHTLAMRLTKKGEDLVTIKKILRHTNINTTTIYSKATTESVEEALVDLKD